MIAPLNIFDLFIIRSPLALLALLLLPVWWWYRRRRPQSAITFSRADVLSRIAGKRSSSRMLFLLRNLVLSLVIIAAARPQEMGRAESVTTSGINIVLAIDLSSSMLAEDFQPQNRLEVAKEKVKQFIRSRQSDRIGIVAFAGEALTQVPLTTDYPIVLQAVDNMHAGQLDDGTAIGMGLATAANRLREAPGKSRVLVLLTDGVNNRGSIDPRSAAQAAAAYNIRIYTIGVGTEGMAPVPVGRGLYGLKYEMQPVEIDEKLLSEIASRSGGRYFRARDAAALERIYSQIDRLERSTVQSRTYVRHAELFRWPLGAALVLLVLELLLTARRSPIP